MCDRLEGLLRNLLRIDIFKYVRSVVQLVMVKARENSDNTSEVPYDNVSKE